MTDKEKFQDAFCALSALHEAASEYGMMTAGLMPLDLMKSDYFKREHERLSNAVIYASAVLRREWDKVEL
jgi:hypothetical protein